MRDLGYVEGQNLIVEHRSSEGRFERLPGIAAELVRLKPDVIARLSSNVAPPNITFDRTAGPHPPRRGRSTWALTAQGGPVMGTGSKPTAGTPLKIEYDFGNCRS